MLGRGRTPGGSSARHPATCRDDATAVLVLPVLLRKTPRRRGRMAAPRRRSGGSELVAGADEVLAAGVVVDRSTIADRIHPLVLELVGEVQAFEGELEVVVQRIRRRHVHGQGRRGAFHVVVV